MQPGGSSTWSKVLYLEDDLELAAVVRQVLEMDGFLVTWFRSGDQLMACLREAVPGPDILLLDHNVEGLSGRECAEQARGLGYSGLIVLMTGEAECVVREALEQCGADRIIGKPISLLELVSVLKSEVERRRTA
jgi:DNA-binding response OmpR family regulator